MCLKNQEILNTIFYEANSIDYEIENEIVRETLKYFKIKDKLDIIEIWNSSQNNLQPTS